MAHISVAQYCSDALSPPFHWLQIALNILYYQWFSTFTAHHSHLAGLVKQRSSAYPQTVIRLFWSRVQELLFLSSQVILILLVHGLHLGQQNPKVLFPLACPVALSTYCPSALQYTTYTCPTHLNIHSLCGVLQPLKERSCLLVLESPKHPLQ